MAAFPRIRPLVWHILITIFVLFTISYFVMGVVLIMSSRLPKPDRLELNSHFSLPVGFLFGFGFVLLVTFMLNVHSLRAPVYIKMNISIILVCIVLQLWPFIQLARTATPNGIEKLVKEDVLARFSEKSNDTKRVIQELQAKYSCCGVSSVRDYPSIAEAPDSCCGKFRNGTDDPVQSIGACEADAPFPFHIREGCASLLMKDLVDAYNYSGLLTVIGLLFGIQIVLVLFGALFHKGLVTKQLS